MADNENSSSVPEAVTTKSEVLENQQKEDTEELIEFIYDYWSKFGVVHKRIQMESEEEMTCTKLKSCLDSEDFNAFREILMNDRKFQTIKGLEFLWVHLKDCLVLDENSEDIIQENIGDEEVIAEPSNVMVNHPDVAAKYKPASSSKRFFENPVLENPIPKSLIKETTSFKSNKRSHSESSDEVELKNVEGPSTSIKSTG